MKDGSDGGPIFKLSLWMLITMGGGLVAGVFYVSTIGVTTEAHTKEIDSLVDKVERIESMRTDIAVIKSVQEDLKAAQQDMSEELKKMNKKLDYQ
jgi:hypothetical protein